MPVWINGMQCDATWRLKRIAHPARREDRPEGSGECLARVYKAGSGCRRVKPPKGSPTSIERNLCGYFWDMSDVGASKSIGAASPQLGEAAAPRQLSGF
jgi:hypothetical protein